MHKDFNDLLSAFNAHNVRYLIVGGYAYARYTEPRTTKDLDLFIRADPENALATFKALAEFGAYLADATVADFAKPGTIFQIGVAPFRIDVISDISGVTFDQAWDTSETALVDDTIPVRYISSDNLIANKLAAGRPQDLIDVEKLRQAAETKKRESAKRKP
ncbi:MAG TPA: nucleotidyltransferase [Acidobacteriaceae bacterium]